MNSHAQRLPGQDLGQGQDPANAALVRSTSKARTPATSAIEVGEIYRGYASNLMKFARRWGLSTEDAEDSTQEFFLRLEEKHSLNTFDHAKGEFRSFLLTLFQRFLANRWKSRHALKRGGGSWTLPLGTLEESENALVDWMTPEKIAHMHWARRVLDHALGKLREDLSRQGKAGLFDALSLHLLHKSSGTSYASLGRQVGLSDTAARKTVSRYRKRLQLLICRELEHNRSGNGRVPDEVRDLFSVLEH